MDNKNKKESSGLRKADRVRNLCIMAHVDHGKTTLADTLIATNGIISEKQAGSIKYMDSRPDEMARGITMKSSCITLAYPHQNESYLINLIDSPGHVDFTSEVSTAVRLCDGCILVVDVVEGVCAQTKAVMRQAWVSGVKPVLVLNKIDRLILEKELAPLDAYYHIANVLEQVNAYMAELYNTDVFGRTNDRTDADQRRSSSSKTAGPSSPSKTEGPSSPSKTEGPSSPSKTEGPYSPSKNSSCLTEGKSLVDWGIEDIDDSDLYFNPTDGNVVFASAIDCWGFGISQFAEQFSSKLGMSLKVLSKTLWGDFYISSKGGEKRILKGARDKRKNPLFVTLILDNLYQVYKKVRPATADPADVRKIADSLNIKMSARLFESASESKTRFMHICSNWLPLSKAVLNMVVLQLPAPTTISEERAKKLLTTATHDFRSLPACSRSLLPHLQRCSSEPSAPLIVYVSKMFGVSCKKLRDADEKLRGGAAPPRGPLPPGDDEDVQDLTAEVLEEPEELLAFARVFSGSLKPGMEVYVLGPKHNPASVAPFMSPDGELSDEHLALCPHITRCKVGGVYLLLGREVQSLGSAGAGLLVGVGGLTGHIVKSGSLSSTPACPPFTHVIHTAGPSLNGDAEGSLLRVQVLPKNPRCLPELREGLRLLNQADPCVQVWLESSGQYMIGAAGEVHLQRCLSDLQDKYARTAVTASAPIVPFRETIVPRPRVDNTNEAIEGENVDTSKLAGDGAVRLDAALGSIRVRAVPLPSSVTELLCANSELLSALSSQSNTINVAAGMASQNSFLKKPSDAFNSQINSLFKETKSHLNDHDENSDVIISNGGDAKSNVSSKTEEKSARDFESEGISVVDSSIETPKEAKANDGDKITDDVKGIQLGKTPEVVKGSEETLPLTSFTSTTRSSPQTLTRETQAALVHLKKQLSEAFSAAGEEWAGAEDQMWTVGPHYCGPNILLNRVPSYGDRPSIWMPKASMPSSPLASMDHALVTGFQLCCAAGSLCEEPLMGVCFLVEDWQPPSDSAQLPPGKVMMLSKELFLNAFDEQPRRMMVATYSCVVSVTSEVVGRVYSVLGRRHGRILAGDITEGSNAWNVTAYLPIVESIDFANELRKATSGEAQPQLMFSHWETLEVDPYWDPCTAEELKHFGQKADTENLARVYMNAVRRRKGIKEYGKKLVEFGEKQRTLTKNK
ncbi:elongation factor-like GTPase 1 [Hyalella azteca]|uniref:Elongation factor-like 1 n=2 Tax=Hyalella azteca TaxID=294128 RepID=A0A8B7NMX5_HYAAZ|nr:elongation factor-like GTPase 1 [Hyalella azteca]